MEHGPLKVLQNKMPTKTERYGNQNTALERSIVKLMGT